jgi:hypothetical protein
MGVQIKKHYWPNGAISHNFIIVNNRIVTAQRFSINGVFVSNMPWLYAYKIQNLRYFFWNTANQNDTVEIIDDYPGN